jgi:RNA polymerase sigma factor (sigma-70 family)
MFFMQAQTHMGTQHVDMADGALIERVLADDQRAFEVLVSRYRGPIFQAIYRILGDYHEAHDVQQQVLLQLYLSLPTLATERPLKPWLLRVAHNRCVDYLRRRRPTLFSELESMDEEDEGMPLFALLDGHPLPEEVVEHHDLEQHIQQAIQALPPRFRSVVLLRYATQLSYTEIGHMLCMAEGTARTYFQRAKPLLRATLAEQ